MFHRYTGLLCVDLFKNLISLIFNIYFNSKYEPICRSKCCSDEVTVRDEMYNYSVHADQRKY